MKKLSIVVIVLFIGFIAVNLQSQDKPVKDDKSKTEKVKDKCEGETSCCSTETTKVSDKKTWNEVCPVKGGKVNPKVGTVEYKGKDYGFCCGGCDAKFKNEPAKYSENISKDGKEFVNQN